MTEIHSAFSTTQQAELEQWFEQKMAAREAAHTPRMAIISTRGTLDAAYPPFILASTAAALGWEVTIFFSFYGLALIKKELDLKLSPLGNPAMPMKLPVGPDWLQQAELNMPNLIKAGVPGFEKMAACMMKKTLSKRGIASVQELRDLAIDADVKLVGCQMTADLFGWQHDAFVPEISEWVGAASFLPIAQRADVTLYM